MPGLSEQQVRDLLKRMDAEFDTLMERAEKASIDGAHSVAASRAMKAHGVLVSFRMVQAAAGIDPYIWAAAEREAEQ
jgi:hypothetical protein